MKRLPFALLALVLALTACQGSSGSLTGVTWRLVSYGPAGAQTDAVAGVPTSLIFSEDGAVGGTMGCNQFGGDYETSGDQITFSALNSTLMACEEPLMTQESAVLAMLSGTVTFEVDGTKLTLTAEDGSVAVFDSTEIEL
jgi:heat shock protein HslJ